MGDIPVCQRSQAKRLSTSFVLDAVWLSKSPRGRKDGQWRRGFGQRTLSRTRGRERMSALISLPLIFHFAANAILYPAPPAMVLQKRLVLSRREARSLVYKRARSGGPVLSSAFASHTPYPPRWDNPGRPGAA